MDGKWEARPYRESVLKDEKPDLRHWGNVSLAESAVCAKVWGKDRSWCIGGTGRRPMRQEQSE